MWRSDGRAVVGKVALPPGWARVSREAEPLVLAFVVAICSEWG